MTNSSATKRTASTASDTAGERYGGKCRVPMWSMGGPAGFCEEVAYGPQYPSRYLHPHQVKSDRLHMPYCYGPCCPAHGGPKDGEPILFTDGTTDDGYPMWCAVMPSFINLQESPAGFSGNPIKAVESLTVALRIAADIQTGAEGRS